MCNTKKSTFAILSNSYIVEKSKVIVNYSGGINKKMAIITLRAIYLKKSI